VPLTTAPDTPRFPQVSPARLSQADIGTDGPAHVAGMEAAQSQPAHRRRISALLETEYSLACAGKEHQVFTLLMRQDELTET